MDIIDTHQHLIFPDRFRYSWSDGIPALAGGFSEEDYTALASQCGIGGAIFMETAPDDAFYQDEVRFVLGLMRREGSLIRGVIAGCRPETDVGFDAWLEETDAQSVVGYRRALHVVPDETSASVTFRNNLRKIGRKGKPFDLCVTQAQLPLAEDLARACDDTVFILDHCGVPAIAGGDFDGWRESIDRIAALPNVCCKISGVVAYCGADQDPEQAVAPYVAHAIAAFGGDRIVWGGDWPVVNLRMTLPEWTAITRRLTDSLDVADREKLFCGNARRLYRL